MLSLTACANSSTGKALQGSLAPDPKLKDNPTSLGQSPQIVAKLPSDFPSEIPLYPKAQLQTVRQPTTLESGLTRWTTADSIASVESFYQTAFQSNGWQMVNQSTNEADKRLVARRNNLQVTVSILPISSPSSPSGQTPPATQPLGSATTFLMEYKQNGDQAAVSQTNPDFIGPAQPANVANSPGNSVAPSSAPSAETTIFTDLNKAPAQLRSYIEDLAKLGVLTADSTASKSNSAAGIFDPNKIISRREYARWLVAANNQIHTNRPGQQIRLAAADSQPAFQDVPRTDPDFPVIQGLAEAGLIPSPLSGDTTAFLFRPDTPLTRENLILWKVPLDTRQNLPPASVEATKQTWGFQDAARIEPKALRAVLADFQNGEQANIRRVFGYTTLFQPKKSVTRAEAAATLWYFGSQSEGISAQDALQLKRQPSEPSPTPSSSPSPSAANQ
jgi:hypothetical protein